MKLQDYVKENWSKLLKSSFDGQELVIVEIRKDEELGYGHHSYEAFGIDAEGLTYWVFSSGCSCNGTVSVDHTDERTVKVFELEQTFTEVDWDLLNFGGMQDEKNSY